jgi:hypothetical protein
VAVTQATISADNEKTENTNLKNKAESGLTLTDSQISTIWPNLPSADELQAMESVFMYDSAEFGKIDSSSKLISDPKASLQKPTMRNYTDYVPPTNELTPIIWLQIKDSTKWIQVPIDILKSTNQTAIPAYRQVAISTETP